MSSAVAFGDIAWQPQGDSTDMGLGSNWNGGAVPGNGQVKSFGNVGSGSDYTVKVPASTAESPYVDKAGLVVEGLADGQKATIDATGAYWLQMGESGTAWSGDKLMRFALGTHIFNIEGLNANNVGDNFGFSFEDGKISFLRDDTNGSRLVFESGTFNNAILPDGETRSSHTTIWLYDTAVSNKVVLGDATTCFRAVSLRGNSVGGEVLVTGGDHHADGGISIGTGEGGNGCPAILHVEGGKFTVDNNFMWLGRDNTKQGVIRVDGNGVFEMAHGSSGVYFPDGPKMNGLLSIGGNGVYRSVSSASLMAGHNGGPATILVEENGFLDHSGPLLLTEHDNGSVSLTVKDNGRVYASNASIASRAGAQVYFDLSGDSVTRLQQGTVAGNATSYFSMSMTNNAVARISDSSGNLNFGDNNGGTVLLDLAGGTLAPFDDASDTLNNVVFKGGPSSVYNLHGVSFTANNIVVQGVQNDDVVDRTTYTNTVRIAGGVINCKGTGLDIQGANRNCMLLFEDGVLNVSATYTRIGHGGNGNGFHSVLRQTGGVMNFASGKVINLCDSSADGEVELFGGVANVYALRGWNQCDVRGGSNKATLYGNGGTLAPWQDSSTFLGTMSAVYVGEKGLIVDSKGFSNVQIRAKVVNKDDADGLFVKKGSGTLKVSLKETDSGAKGDFINRSLAGEQTYTRIDEGTLVFTDVTDAVFGRNVTVKGGATLSLVGATETLTVDTLTLGDGNGAATLALDSGDTIIVNAENGLSMNVAMIDFSSVSVNGEYPVFVCTGAVDIATVSDMNIIPNASHDCEWIGSYDDETDWTTFSIHVVDAGTIGKTITYDNGSVTTNGEGRVARLIANETGAQYGQLDLTSAPSATVDADVTLTLGGDLRIPAGGTLSKHGSGKLVVDGDNSNFIGSFASHGGMLEVDDVDALGKDPLSFPLVLGNGTFKYTGDAVTFNAALKLNGETAGKSVILENDGDMTFSDVQHVRGTFVKKGTGKLTLDLPAGSFKLGNDAVDGDYGKNNGTVVFPASGDAPESKTGLYGVTIAEGALKVKGAGVDQTTLSTENTSLLGTGYAAQAAPVLEVEDARVNFGKGSRHGTFMTDYPSTSPTPEVRLNNAYLYTNSGTIGNSTSPTGGRGPIITMTNSTFYSDYNTILGSAGYASPEIDANNSSFVTAGDLGITIAAATLTADFYGTNAVFGSYSTGNGGFIASHNHPNGKIKIRDGARMKTTKGIGFSLGSVDIEFDGGIFEIAHHNSMLCTTSTWNNVSKGIVTKGAGMAVEICEGSTHGFNFPIKGEGKVVKTGAGTFELVAPRAEEEFLVQYTGGTVVSNGTLVVDGSLVADGSKTFEVEADATLDLAGSTLSGATLSGAGIVTNGTLSAATLVYDEDAKLTFMDVAIGGTLFVDFGKTAEDPLDKAAARAGIVVAHFTGVAPDVVKVKALNTGIPRVSAKLACVDGDIVVSAVQAGFSVVIR